MKKTSDVLAPAIYFIIGQIEVTPFDNDCYVCIPESTHKNTGPYMICNLAGIYFAFTWIGTLQRAISHNDIMYDRVIFFKIFIPKTDSADVVLGSKKYIEFGRRFRIISCIGFAGVLEPCLISLLDQREETSREHNCDILCLEPENKFD